MIKAFQLIFEPAITWDKIARARRSLVTVLFLYLTPLVALSVAGELWGRIYLGKHHFTDRATAPHNLVVEYGVTLFLFSFLALRLHGGARRQCNSDDAKQERPAKPF